MVDAACLPRPTEQCREPAPDPDPDPDPRWLGFADPDGPCMAFAWVVTSTAPRFVFGSGESTFPTLRARGMPAHEYAAPSPR